MRRWSAVIGALAASRLWAPAAALGHYDKRPCTHDEVQGEVQGEPGYICAPRCSESNYDCATDVPDGTTAQPQCMLTDLDRGAFCALLCQMDAQCPSGATCRQIRQAELGVCMYPVSFSDWAKPSGITKKLVVGWPSQRGKASSFKVAKAYASLQNLKRKYGIEDGDSDVLAVKELLSSLQANSDSNSGSSSGGSSGGGSSGGSLGGGALGHDVSYLARNLRDGVPGLQREIHDTVWNIEHIESYGVASTLLRGVMFVMFCYVALGMAYKNQTMGATGLDMVPHIGFWLEYPQLVMDGVQYTKMFVFGTVGSASGFEPVGSSRERDAFNQFTPTDK